MLTQLFIRDFAIIHRLELALDPGLSALTGETGAGKSILIDALNLVLGDRADSHTVRHGAERAEITVTVRLEGSTDTAQWLEAHDLAQDDECILRRVVSREGRSRAYINGSPVTLNLLREIGETLVDIHGQHEHQSLLRRDMQRRLLDRQADNGDHLKRLGALYRRWSDLSRRLSELSLEQEERRARLDLLRYQVEELADLGLADAEFGALEEEHQRLNHAEELKREAYQAYWQVYESEEGSLHSRLGMLVAGLEHYIQVDPALQAATELLNGAQAQLEEAATELRQYSDALEVSPERLQWIDERLTTIHELARKHRIPPQDLVEHLAKLEAELSSLTDPDADLAQLRLQIQQTGQAYLELAGEIRERRLHTAKALSEGVTDIMQELGMDGGRFEAAVRALDEAAFSETGLDEVEFMVSANPGIPLQALTRVASGGELSRISLAIQVIAARSVSIPTLIFDEVDAGIGGGIAEVVGRQLRRLGGERQVLCVTHLPQVAAQAHHHCRVTKTKGKTRTTTAIHSLSDEERIEEIARMLGGMTVTAQTRAHAEEMITQSRSP